MTDSKPPAMPWEGVDVDTLLHHFHIPLTASPVEVANNLVMEMIGPQVDLAEKMLRGHFKVRLTTIVEMTRADLDTYAITLVTDYPPGRATREQTQAFLRSAADFVGQPPELVERVEGTPPPATPTT